MNYDNNGYAKYLNTCYIADKLFNEYFDNYLYRKTIMEIRKLDIYIQDNNKILKPYYELSMVHHIYFYKKLRIIYDQFGSNIFNNYDRIIIINNLDDLNNYIGEEDYEIIINMYINIFEFEKERELIKRKDTIRDIMLKSKWLSIDLINNIIKYLSKFI